ncbi:MAG: hypothetical protein ACQESW_09865 [Bacteroidota bacterium]
MNTPYPVFLFLGLTIGLYIISWLFTRFSSFRFPDHRRIWNLLLAMAFLVTGSMGLVMGMSIVLDRIPEGMSTLLKIHVSAGMVWVVIAFFHFIWHLKYFRKALQRLLKL